MIETKKTQNQLIRLHEQKKLAQNYVYASWLRAKLRKNRNKLKLNYIAKTRFQSVKKALTTFKKNYLTNLKAQRLINKENNITKKTLGKSKNKKLRRTKREKRWIVFSNWWNYKNKKKLVMKTRYFPKSSNISLIKNTDIFGSKLNLIIKPNNVFCNFSTFKDNKTTDHCSSGKYGIKVTKKTLRYTYDWVLARFFKIIKPKIYLRKKVLIVEKQNKYQRKNQKKVVKKTKKKFRYQLVARKNSALYITLISNSRVRKRIIRAIRYNFKGLPLIIKIIQKKVFNGCRAAKKVRKKRRRMRVYK